jgi:hypothetical protein
VPSLHTLHVIQGVIYAVIIAVYSLNLYDSVFKRDRRGILLNGLVVVLWIFISVLFVLTLHHGGG